MLVLVLVLPPNEACHDAPCVMLYGVTINFLSTVAPGLQGPSGSSSSTVTRPLLHFSPTSDNGAIISSDDHDPSRFPSVPSSSCFPLPGTQAKGFRHCRYNNTIYE